jgi:hypothetical protein
MKTTGFQKVGLTLGTALAAAVFTTNVFGQAMPAQPTPQFNDIAPPANAAAAATPAPGLSPATAQVLQLSQAKVSDSTIITFVQNSGSMYGLDASQIVYLKQQGISDGVINAMLNQRTVLAASAAQQPPPPDYSAQSATPAPITTVDQPTTPAPSSVYVVPDTQTYYYDNWSYPYYSYGYPYYYYGYGWPAYWGWGGYGGWRGGGWHGGGFHGPGGGGFHGPVGGGFHGNVGGGGFHGGGGGGGFGGGHR